MTDEKIKFCIELGMAMPLSCSTLMSLEKLGYLNCFRRIDINDQLSVDIYIVLHAILIKINQDKNIKFNEGDVFHVKDTLFRHYLEDGSPEDYYLTE
jgi:hypothetical protein